MCPRETYVAMTNGGQNSLPTLQYLIGWGRLTAWMQEVALRITLSLVDWVLVEHPVLAGQRKPLHQAHRQEKSVIALVHQRRTERAQFAGGLPHGIEVG